MKYTIPGHHHISMITKNAGRNNRFYRDILGLRRVKVTVNQDEPSMYHLFYGDKTGSPGRNLPFLKFRQRGVPTGGQMRLRESAFSFLPRRALRIGKTDLPNTAFITGSSPPTPTGRRCISRTMKASAWCFKPQTAKNSISGKHGKNRRFRRNTKFWA